MPKLKMNASYYYNNFYIFTWLNANKVYNVCRNSLANLKENVTVKMFEVKYVCGPKTPRLLIREKCVSG